MFAGVYVCAHACVHSGYQTVLRAQMGNSSVIHARCAPAVQARLKYSVAEEHKNDPSKNVTK